MTPEEYVRKRLIPGYKAAKVAKPNCIVMGAGLGTETITAKKTVKAIETMIDVLDGLAPLEAKQQSVGKGALFEIVFENPEDRSKKVTVFWYTEMYGTGQKDSVEYSDDEMAVVLSVDSKDVYLVDMEGKITSPSV